MILLFVVVCSIILGFIPSTVVWFTMLFCKIISSLNAISVIKVFFLIIACSVFVVTNLADLFLNSLLNNAGVTIVLSLASVSSVASKSASVASLAMPSVSIVEPGKFCQEQSSCSPLFLVRTCPVAPPAGKLAFKFGVVICPS